LLRAFVPARPVTHGAFGLALFLAQPSFHAIVLGQWSLLLMSAVAGTVLARRAARPMLAPVPSLLFLAKPQLVVFTAIGFAYGAIREPVFRRYVIYGLLLAGAVIAIAWIAAPRGWFSAWLEDIPARRTLRSAVLPSALNQLLGPPGRYLAYALIGAGALLAARFRPGSDASLAAWITLSSAGAIYSWSYDQVLLFVPAVITAGILTRRSEGASRRISLAAVGIDREAPAGQGLIRGSFPQDLVDKGPYDVIALLAVFEHVHDEDRPAFVAACRALLRRGGRVVVTVPAPLVDRIVDVLRKLRLLHRMDIHAHHGYRPEQTPMYFADAGMRLVTHERFELRLNHLFEVELPAN